MDLNAFKKWAIDQGSVAKFTDAKYKGQCVSLISQYLGRVYGIKAGAWGNAKDWATNAEVAKLFTKVGSPQAGDIGVSGATRTNPYGHIWIYLTPTQILEQNGRVPLRVSIGVPIFKPIAILRRKGQEQDMNITNHEQVDVLYQAALGRRAETVKAKENWMGKDIFKLVWSLIGSSEYQQRNDIVGRAYPEALKKIKEIEASGGVKPTKLNPGIYQVEGK